MFKSGFIKLNKDEQPEVKITKASSNDERGVVYLGHVPHGFYENEMKHYFTQFGEVTNVKIPKSKKTGKARGYAFIEFMYPEVAKVVAETMNNYLMHKKILVAKYLPPNQVKSNTFWRCNKNNVPLTIKNRSIQRKAMERPLDPEKNKKCKISLDKRMKSFQKKLKSKGIEYEIQFYNPKTINNSNMSKVSTENTDNDNNSKTEICSTPDTGFELNNGDDETPPKTIPKISKKNKRNKRL